MKNGKHPTLAQKKFIKSHGLDPEEHLVVKNTQEFLEVVSKTALKKEKLQGTRTRTKKLYKCEENKIETVADNQKAFVDTIKRHQYHPLSETEKQGLTEEEIFRKEYGLYTDFVYHRKWVEKFKEIYGREPKPL